EPQHLIVLALAEDGSAREIYNGPGAMPWESAGRMQKNGQRPIGVARLEALMEDVPEEDRLPARANAGP
ncbi:MAG: hypothetical protein K8E66_00865, partial [Phycisphaerales bacterium]|nr:hypothetical protein [Phycisphaerales bacterium]